MNSVNLAGGTHNLALKILEVLSVRAHVPLALFLDRGERVGAEFTGTQLRDRAFQWADALVGTIPAGQPVLLIMPPGLDFLTALLGCLFAGAIAVPLPVPRPGEHNNRIDAVMADCHAAAIVCNAESAASLRQNVHKASPEASHPRLIVLDELSGPPNDLGDRAAYAGFGLSPDDTVIIQYTSGSTRQPRGAALSGRNVLSNAELVAARWRLGGNDVAINWLPHYHDMGLMGGILYPLLWGGRSVQMSPLAFVQKPIRWLRAIAAHGGSLSGGPSFAYGLCLDAISDHDLVGLDLSQWKVAYCGAEPVPSNILQRFRERFQRAGLVPSAVHACYGLAEATLLVAGERDWSGDPVFPPAESSGTEPCRLSPVTRATLRIVDPDSALEVADGREGEIWVSSPSVASGYFNHPEASAEIFGMGLPGRSERYLRTGDMGMIGPEGLSITGRLKDILIADGVNVAAIDVEWLAAQYHPALNPLAAAAFSLDPQTNGGAALLIEVKAARSVIEDHHAIIARIRAAVRAAHGIDFTCIHFVKRGSLDRTTSGKIRRQFVAARFRAGHRYLGIDHD